MRQLMNRLVISKIQYLRNSCATYHIFLAHTEKKICFRFIYNTKKLKCSKLCFYRPKYIRGTSARLIRLAITLA